MLTQSWLRRKAAMVPQIMYWWKRRFLDACNTSLSVMGQEISVITFLRLSRIGLMRIQMENI
jgi:hypothetical protein